jgi:biotin synthase
MGCAFCSHAARWDVYTDKTLLSEEEIVEQAGDLADGGADFVVLRTTQFYPTETLVSLGQRVRDRIGDEIHLVVNTGESGPDRVKALRDGGFNMAYHVVRLREGVDTGHSVEMRLRTIEAIRSAGMELQYLIEPLGLKHGGGDHDRGAARRARWATSGTGVMARVPVMGTPLARLGQVSEPYLRRVAAAARLEYPDGGKYLCVHPPTPSAFRTGCNTVVVEQAANPRDTASSASAWRRFDLNTARTALREAGFQVRKRKSV